MLHSFPRRQQRGRSMKSTRGFGFTVKWRKRLTTSLSDKILDWAGPDEMMTRTKDKDQGVCVLLMCFGRERNWQRMRAEKHDMTVLVLLCFCSPAANSSMVMRGKRMSVRALPRTLRLFSGVGCSCCLWASASAQRTAAPNKRTSLTPRVSLSNTATRVSNGGRDETSIVS